MEIYRAKVSNIVANGEATAELRNMVAGADFMPMVS